MRIQTKMITALGEIVDLFILYSNYQEKLVSVVDDGFKTKLQEITSKFESLYNHQILEQNPGLFIALEYAKSAIFLLKTNQHSTVSLYFNQLQQMVDRIVKEDYQSVFDRLAQTFKKAISNNQFAEWYPKVHFFKRLGTGAIYNPDFLDPDTGQRKASGHYYFCVFDWQLYKSTGSWTTAGIITDLLGKIILTTKEADVIERAMKHLKIVEKAVSDISPASRHFRQILVEKLLQISGGLVECKERKKTFGVLTAEERARFDARELIMKIYHDPNVAPKTIEFLKCHFREIGLFEDQKNQSKPKFNGNYKLWWDQQGPYAPKKIENPLNVKPARNPFERHSEILRISAEVPFLPSFSSDTSNPVKNPTKTSLKASCADAIVSTHEEDVVSFPIYTGNMTIQ